MGVRRCNPRTPEPLHSGPLFRPASPFFSCPLMVQVMAGTNGACAWRPDPNAHESAYLNVRPRGAVAQAASSRSSSFSA
jgi:hypothetical protein